jgi:hypothetical protein
LPSYLFEESAADASGGEPARVVDACAGAVPAVFTAPGFETFVVLVAGLVAAPAGRGAGGSHGVRDADRGRDGSGVASQPGAPVLRRHPVERRRGGVGGVRPHRRLAGSGRAPVVVAIDDTMFRRSGRKVHAAH